MTISKYNRSDLFLSSVEAVKISRAIMEVIFFPVKTKLMTIYIMEVGQRATTAAFSTE